MLPHSALLFAQVTDGVQPPHTLGVPLPPQLCGAVHAGPQLAMPPQPSAILPQLAFAGQVAFLHVTTVTCAVAACTAEAALPMTMNVGAGVPVSGAAAVAVKVSVEVLPAVTLGGVNAPLTPAGRS